MVLLCGPRMRIEPYMVEHDVTEKGVRSQFTKQEGYVVRWGDCEVFFHAAVTNISEKVGDDHVIFMDRNVEPVATITGRTATAFILAWAAKKEVP